MAGELSLEAVYRDYRGRILRYLTRLAGEVDAEDLTQEVFYKVGKALGDFRGESDPATWIYRIATNAALDRFRSHAFRDGAGGQDPLAITSVEAIDPSDPWTGLRNPTVEEQAIREEMSGCVRDIVDRLPEEHRTMIVLSDLEGFKDGEIADILGVSLNAVKMRLHRARARLRKELSNQCVLYRNDENELACDRKDPHGQITDPDRRESE